MLRTSDTTASSQGIGSLSIVFVFLGCLALTAVVQSTSLFSRKQRRMAQRLRVFPPGMPSFNSNWQDAPNIFESNRLGLNQSFHEAIEAGCLDCWTRGQMELFFHMGVHWMEPNLDREELAGMVWLQMEPDGSGYHNRPRLVSTDRMEQMSAVWDFSPSNVDSLGSGFDHYFYVPLWTSLDRRFIFHEPARKDKDIDVLVFGSINRRRKEICDDLGAVSDLTVVCEPLWAEELADKLNRTRLLLNVHMYPLSSLEVHRVNRALAHGMAIVSESSFDPTLDEIYSDVITFSPYENLKQTVIDKLSQTEEELMVERRRNAKWMAGKVSQVDEGFCSALTHLCEATMPKLEKLEDI